MNKHKSEVLPEHEQLSADVAHCVEELLTEQKRFDHEIREKLAVLDKEIADVFELQQKALRKATATLSELIKSETAWRPRAGSASSN